MLLTLSVNTPGLTLISPCIGKKTAMKVWRVPDTLFYVNNFLRLSRTRSCFSPVCVNMLLAPTQGGWVSWESVALNLCQCHLGDSDLRETPRPSLEPSITAVGWVHLARTFQQWQDFSVLMWTRAGLWLFPSKSVTGQLRQEMLS